MNRGDSSCGGRFGQAKEFRKGMLGDLIFDTSPLPLIVLDDAFRVVTANQSFQTTFGDPLAAITGRVFYELQNHRWDQPALRRHLDEIRTRSSISESYELVIEEPGGERRVEEVSGRLLSRGSLEEDLLLVVIGDVTERRKAHQDRARLAVVVESCLDAIISMRPDGTIQTWNKGAERLYGYSAAEAIGQPISIVVPPERIHEVNEIGLKVHAGECVEQMHTERVRKDGTRVDVSMTVSPIFGPDGELTATSVIVRDVSERRRVEREVREMNEALVSQSLKLKAVNRELEAFTYSASHDLSAPLRSIGGFSRALLEDYGEVLDSRGKDYLRRICTATKNMSQLITSLLSLSRVGRTEVVREDINLSDMARDAVASVRESNPGREVAVQIAEGIRARCDRKLMRIALENLIRNAWVYTSNAQAPRIEFGTTSQDGTVVYYVRDNGAGFDMAYADRLFLPFQRLHSASEFPGTGIGLPLVERIMARHGGRIWAEGEVGKGATFYFTLQDE